MLFRINVAVLILLHMLLALKIVYCTIKSFIALKMSRCGEQPQPQTPRMLAHVNSGTPCDGAINAYIDAMNRNASIEARNVYNIAYYQWKHCQWENRIGSYADPVRDSGPGWFPLDGRSGIAVNCQTGNPEDHPNNDAACQDGARILGVPYYNDYQATFPSVHIDYRAGTYADCTGRWWMAACRRASDSHYKLLEPKPPVIEPTVSTNPIIQCCSQTLNLTGVDVTVDDVNMICRVDGPDSKQESGDTAPDATEEAGGDQTTRGSAVSRIVPFLGMIIVCLVLLLCSIIPFLVQ